MLTLGLGSFSLFGTDDDDDFSSLFKAKSVAADAAFFSGLGLDGEVLGEGGTEAPATMLRVFVVETMLEVALASSADSDTRGSSAATGGAAIRAWSTALRVDRVLQLLLVADLLLLERATLPENAAVMSLEIAPRLENAAVGSLRGTKDDKSRSDISLNINNSQDTSSVAINTVTVFCITLHNNHARSHVSQHTPRRMS
jgi:hypothetical protein